MKKKSIQLEFPKIGLRIIKSAIGILLCYIVNILRNGKGIVFYSQLAVLWCMQDYISETKAKAKQRTIGTAIGAIYGLLFLLLFQLFPIRFDSIIEEMIRGISISLSVVAILYTTVVLKKKDASYFSCVVFLSIVVNHLNDADPYLFVWNRFLDTMIGIVLGVVINCFSLPKHKNRDLLFVSGVDETLLDKHNNLTGFEKVELNRMIEDGAKFTVSTLRTPASIMESLSEIKFLLPVIVMDGAALYDFNEKRYLHLCTLSENYSKEIMSLLDSLDQPYFTNVIYDDLLIIYYSSCDLPIYNQLVASLRKSPYRNYLNRKPDYHDIAYFMLIDKSERIEYLYIKMKEELAFFDDLKILKYPSQDYSGYSYIKIYDHNATRENMLLYLSQEIPHSKIITFGTIPNRYTYTIKPGDSSKVVKLMKKEYEGSIFR